MIVANNTVWGSWLVARQPCRSGSADLPATSLALSEFHYCRHNIKGVVFNLAASTLRHQFPDT
jgi:hypothetical protein